MTKDKEEVLDTMGKDLMEEQIKNIEDINEEAEKEEIFSAYENGLGSW